MSEHEPNNPDHLQHHPHAVEDRVLAYTLAHVEKPYRDMAAQALLLGKQAVEREQTLESGSFIEANGNEQMMDRVDFMRYAEEHGRTTAAASRTWNAMARDGAHAFGVTFDGSWYDVPLPISAVFARLNGLVPENATQAQKYNHISRLGMRQFGAESYDLVLSYCRDRLEEEQTHDKA